MRTPTIAMMLVTLAVTAAAAQSTPPAPEPYRPGLGDLMTMTVQPRHIKLLLAGNAQNWIYAKYELRELQEAFDRVVRVWPRYKGLPLGGMIDAIAKGPLGEVDKAIDAKNSAAFRCWLRGSSPKGATPAIRQRMSDRW